MNWRKSIAALAFASLCISRPSSAEPASTTYGYDSNGNLTSKVEGGVEWKYVYDARNLLREVARDGILIESNQYDAAGRRVRKASPAGVVRFVWDGPRIVGETDDYGNAIAEYVYAGDRLVAIRHVVEGTSFIHTDSLGSTTSLSAADGSLVTRYELDAWGVPGAQAGTRDNEFLFTGYQYDRETGLYYAKGRFYEPRQGRFISEDPALGKCEEPRSLWRYPYAYDNPTTYIDPYGREVAVGHKGYVTITDQDGNTRAIPPSEVAANPQAVRTAMLTEGNVSPAEADQYMVKAGQGDSVNAAKFTQLAQGVDVAVKLVAGELKVQAAAGAAGAATAAVVTALAGPEVGVPAGRAVAIGVAADLSGGVVAKLTEDYARGQDSTAKGVAISAVGWAAGGLVLRGAAGVTSELGGAKPLTLGESAKGPGVVGSPTAPEFGPPPDPPHSSSGLDRHRTADPPTTNASGEQPRDSLGRFLSKNHPGQAAPGASAVDDFVLKAQQNGFEVIGREVSVDTPFGLRRYDVVLRDKATGQVHGIEIKSSQEAFDRFDQPARQQFAADRWVNTYGANAVGRQQQGLVIDSATKVLWEAQ